MSEILKIFVKNEKALRRYISRLGPRAEDVEDLTQQTFLHGFAAETRCQIKEPKAFLFRIAKNIVLAERRKTRRRPADFLEDLGGPEIILDESRVDTDACIDGRRKLAVFAKAVAHLPPQCRKAFLLRRVEGLQYRQIANRMNISVSAVEKHVTAGLLKCNSFLRAHGYDPSEFGGSPAKAVEQSIERIMNGDERD